MLGDDLDPFMLRGETLGFSLLKLFHSIDILLHSDPCGFHQVWVHRFRHVHRLWFRIRVLIILFRKLVYQMGMECKALPSLVLFCVPRPHRSWRGSVG